MSQTKRAYDKFLLYAMLIIALGVVGFISATTVIDPNYLNTTGGVVAVTGTFSGALTGTTLDTGQGANELFDMDQNVLQASAVTFSTVNTGQGANELYDMNQNVETTSAVTFSTVNTGQGANELYDMDQNVLQASAVVFENVTVSDSITLGGVTRSSWFGGTGSGSNISTCDYIIFVAGGNYYAQNGDTGIVDYSGTNFASVVESAITAAGGGDIYLKSGSYELTSDNGIDINVAGTHLHGAGYDTVIECESGFSDHMIHIGSSGTGTYINELRIDGSGQDANHAIYVEATRCQFYTLRIEDFYDDGIHAGHSGWIGVLGGKITDCVIDDSTAGSGIYMDYDATDWEIIDCLISNMDTTGQAGVMVDAGSTLIMGCHLWGNTYDIRVAPAHHVYRLRVVGNKIADNDEHGFYMGNSYDLRASYITGNEFWANGYEAPYNESDAICFNGTAGPGMDIVGLTITGNAFFGYKEDVAQQCTRYAINDVADDMRYCVITGNTFYQMGVTDPVNVTTGTNVDMANAYYNCDGYSGIDVTG